MRKGLFILFMVCAFFAHAQSPVVESVRIDTLTTTERDLLTNEPARAKLIYNSTTAQLEVQSPGGTWSAIGGGGGGADQTLSINGTDLTISGGSGNTVDLSGLQESQFAYVSDYGADGTLANDTLALRLAYDTGKIIKVDIDTLVIDNVKLEGQDHFFLDADGAVIKRADDPGLTEAARFHNYGLYIGEEHKNIYFFGRQIWDGNFSSADGLTGNSWAPADVWTANKGTFMLYIDADNDIGADDGIMGWDDLTFINQSNGAFRMNGGSQDRDFAMILGGDVTLIDAVGNEGFTIRGRYQGGGVIVGDVLVKETGGRKDRWNEIGYGTVRGCFSLQVGEASIYSTHAEFVYVNSFTSLFGKYGLIGSLAAKRMILGPVQVSRFLWNEDLTYHWETGGSIVPMKWGGYAVSEATVTTERWNVESIQYVATNNINALPNYATGGADSLQNSVHALQIPEEAKGGWIGMLDIDGHSNLYGSGAPDGDDSQPLYIGTIIFRGCDAGNDLTMNGRIIVDNLILTNETNTQEEADATATRTRIVNIGGEVKINSLQAVVNPDRPGNQGGTVNLSGVGVREQKNRLNYWQYKSDIRLNNVYLPEEYTLQATGDIDFYGNSSSGSTFPYFKCHISNSYIANFGTFLIQSDNQLIQDPGDYVDFQPRMQWIIDNSELGMTSDYWYDVFVTNVGTTDGLLTELSSAGSTDLEALDPLVYEAGIFDLPSGVKIGASRIHNSVIWSNDTPQATAEGDLLPTRDFNAGANIVIDSTNTQFQTQNLQSIMNDLDQESVLTSAAYENLSTEEKSRGVKLVIESPCTDDANDLNSTANAAGNCSIEELSTGGWTSFNGAGLSAVSSTSTDGVYCIRVEQGPSGYTGARFTFTGLTISDSYDIYFDIKYENKTDQMFRIGVAESGWVIPSYDPSPEADGQWIRYKYTNVTATATSATLPFYPMYNPSGLSGTGAIFYIDNVRVVPHVP